MMVPMRRLHLSLLLLAAVAPIVGLAGCAGDGSAAAVDDSGPTTTDKVTVAGDSISVGLGAALRATVPTGVEVKVIGEEGSGLARPDRFDWPARLTELARDFPPTVLVFSVGSNDAQDLRDASGAIVAPLADTEVWEAEYRRRLGAAFDAFAGSDTLVVWVGHVRTAEDRVGDANRRIHELAVEEAEARPHVEVADLAELLGTGDAVAARCLMDDGLHVTVACLEEAAAALTPDLPVG